MKGKVVITSKQEYPYSEARKMVSAEEKESVIGHCTIKEGANYVIWHFSTEDEAIRHAREFMQMGFEYVQREV